jgi:hypothetical protein
MERKARTILLNHVGWKARKHPAKGGVFFLTFPFIELPGIRTYQDLRQLSVFIVRLG